MSFSYYDNENNIKRLNIEVGKEWSTYKENCGNSLMNSVFDAVDNNADGKVDENELKLLIEKIDESDLNTLIGNELPKLPETINIPDDIDKLQNINYNRLISNNDEKGEKYVYESNECIDFSILKNLKKGKYYIDSWEELLNENGTVVKRPIVRKIQESNQDKTKNWSAGINRTISKIQIQNAYSTTPLISFLENFGEKEGIIIELLDGNEGWIKDLSVTRADKKQLIPNCNKNAIIRMCNNEKNIIAKRNNITSNMQGHAFQSDDNEKIPNAIKYSNGVNSEDIIKGKTYLEGGNVLNTLTEKGNPAVIIGEESLLYTIQAMELDDSTKSREIASKQIAKELGIKRNNITYIPQFDFHIDMYYRPLNNGQIAIPDYEAGINILKNLTQSFNIKTESENIEIEESERYTELIRNLEILKNKIQDIINDSEKKLIKQGYEIVKIPCFTEINNDQKEDKCIINYMNGICGTSTKTGNKFYITNSSGDNTLDEIMEKYFIEHMGVDKVYFAPSQEFLHLFGGIDCLTKEF